MEKEPSLPHTAIDGGGNRHADFILSRLFRYPAPGGTFFIIVKRGLAPFLPFLPVYAERLLHCSGAREAFIIVEDPTEYPALAAFDGKDFSGCAAHVVPLGSPLSSSIARVAADGLLPATAASAVLFCRLTDLEESGPYRWMRPLMKELEQRVDRIFLTFETGFLLTYLRPRERTLTLPSGPICAISLLTPEDVRLIYQYVHAAAGGRIVEIGRYLGGSTNVIARAIRDAGRATTFDSYDPALPDLAVETLQWNGLDGVARLHAATSAEGFADWQAKGRGEIDLLFIDGDHSHAAVAADVATWGSLVKRGGILIAHDHCSGGVNYSGVDVVLHRMLTKENWDLVDCCFISAVFRRR